MNNSEFLEEGAQRAAQPDESPESFHAIAAVESAEGLSFKLEVFEGPLDLLLKLISKNKVSIYDIPISLIFREYMEYLEEMRRLDMDIAGEFISMAAELMLIKSRMLLPKAKLDGSEEDPRAALAAALAEYKRAKETAVFLQEQYALYGGRMIKETDEISEDKSYVAPQQLEYLMEAFTRIARRQRLMREAMTEEPAKTLDVILKKKITPIHEKIFGVLRILKRKGKCDFETLMTENKTRSDLIASFVAVLQLIRRGEILIVEEADDGNPILEINYDRPKRKFTGTDPLREGEPDDRDGGIF